MSTRASRFTAFIDENEPLENSTFTPEDGYDFMERMTNKGATISSTEPANDWPYLWGFTPGNDPLTFAIYAEGDVSAYTFKNSIQHREAVRLWELTDEENFDDLSCSNALPEYGAEFITAALEHMKAFDIPLDEDGVMLAITLYQGNFYSDEEYAEAVADEYDMPDVTNLYSKDGDRFPSWIPLLIDWTDCVLHLQNTEGFAFSSYGVHYFKDEA